MVLVTSN